MMEFIETLDDLHGHYGAAAAASVVKVTPGLIPSYREFIERSRLCILTTVGPEGTDASPRGDDGPVVRVLDPRHLALPDWHGNNRIDSLRNIIRDPRVSLMFLIAGSNNVIRVNGSARLTADPELRESFARAGKSPRTVILIKTEEVYPQCARAFMRAAIWVMGDQSEGLPSIGDMLKEVTSGGVDGATYDAEWPARAVKTMW